MASIPGLELLEKHRWEIVGFDYVSQDEHFVDEHGHIARWIGKSKSSHKRLIVRKIRNHEPPKQCVASGPVSLGPETIQAIAKAVAVELRLNWADRMVEPVKNVPLADGLVGVWVPSNNPTASLNSDEIPKGYRKLGDAKSEPRIEGDSYWSVGAKGWFPLVEELVRFANLENWAACRKIEEPEKPWRPKIGERVVLKATGAIYRIASYNDNSKQYSMEGWPGSCVNLENIAPWFENEEPPKRYREPTLVDLANGPIECKYREHDGATWRNGFLASIVDGEYPFFIQDGDDSGWWELCQIEDK